jgi:nucleoid-associated protein YgaU
MAGFSLGSDDGSLFVEADFGEAEPKVVAGAANFDKVARPRNKALTEWTGTDPVQLQLSFFFDAFAEGDPTAIERSIRVLERMNGQGAGSGFQPPALIVTGDPAGVVPCGSHEWPNVRWWLESIAYDDGTLRDDSGRRVRCGGTVLLTEVVADDTLAAIAGSDRTTKASKPKKVTVKTGDTLAKIANRYKVKGGWKALAKANNIRDPKKIKVGQSLRIP